MHSRVAKVGMVFVSCLIFKLCLCVGVGSVQNVHVKWS